MSFFNSRRSNVTALNGAVATSQPLAAQAGMQVLLEGGNAVDAAVCMAATLAVVEPMSTGLGGDVFALVWSEQDKKVYALNGSGRSGVSATAEEVSRRGFTAIPTEGEGAAMSVTVPGTVAGWQSLLEKFGSFELAELLQPAIRYAVQGFPVTELIAYGWAANTEKLRYRPSGGELLLNGRAPRFGEVVQLPQLGATLQLVAEGGSEAFYQGKLARAICEFVQAEGGWLTEQDLRQHYSEWVEPIASDYRGVQVWECPPNGQGIAALIALNIVEGFDLSENEPQSAQRYHLLIEAMRLAFADALQHVADPARVAVPVEQLLSKDYAAKLRKLIGFRAMGAPPGDVTVGEGGDTVYASAVDKDGNACSIINSLYQGFGSGLVVPGTGIALQNRGALFTLKADHPNVLLGSKRPYHTIIPAMATRNNEFWLSFGVMGGFQQPQGHLQVISNIVDYGMSPQQALNALRFSLEVTGSMELRVEDGFLPVTWRALARRGHNVTVVEGNERTLFGGGQIVARDPESGVIMAGTEPRKDGCALGW